MKTSSRRGLNHTRWCSRHNSTPWTQSNYSRMTCQQLKRQFHPNPCISPISCKYSTDKPRHQSWISLSRCSQWGRSQKKRKKRKKEGKKQKSTKSITFVESRFLIQCDQCKTTVFWWSLSSYGSRRSTGKTFFGRGLDILRRKYCVEWVNCGPNQRPRVRPKADLWDVVWARERARRASLSAWKLRARSASSLWFGSRSESVFLDFQGFQIKFRHFQ